MDEILNAIFGPPIYQDEGFTLWSGDQKQKGKEITEMAEEETPKEILSNESLAEKIVDYVKTFDDEFTDAHENLSEEGVDQFEGGLRTLLERYRLGREEPQTD